MVMGSVGTPNPWGPYDTSRDCSQRVCSIYCPQWCYIYFPPPPPFDPKEDDSGSPLSPMIIAVISILAIAFLLVGYYTIISKYCKRRGDSDPNPELDQDNLDQIAHDQWQVASAGLDVTLIKSITVCKYKKDEGLVEGTDCAVCLSEFQEDESLRLLPRCSHAFHLPCIDTWLKSHSTCPLCRANIVLSNPLPLPAPNQQNSFSLNISSLEFQHQDDLILVVEDDEERCHQERAVMSFDNEIIPKNAEMGNNTIEIGEDNVQQLRRSVSFGSFTPQRQLFIADILRIDGNEEDLQLQNVEFPTRISSSKRSLAEQSMSNNTNWEMGRGPAGMMRTVSTGRFVFTEYGRRNNTVFPN